MIEKNAMERMPEKWKKLSRYLNCKEYYEKILLSMFIDNEISQEEYDRILYESEQAYKQFRKDLVDDKKLMV